MAVAKHQTSPTYAEFLNDYLIPNRPLLIAAGYVARWEACRLWNDPNSHDNIDWSYLSATYGSLDVSVTDCLANDPSPSQMKFGDVIEKWAYDHTQLLYLKDWHLPRWAATPFYSTPPVFADDWLNCYYSTFTDDDFRFVYIGVKGTFTPFHKDVYDSYSWSVNVVGKKLWTFWTPDDPHQSHPGIDVIQEAGETMFVPSGWYHTVYNLTTCISINHNWCNSVNLPSMYHAICLRIQDVERELDDVREMLASEKLRSETRWEIEWMNIVQDVLEKDAGWNWSTFWDMVLHGLQTSIGIHDSARTTLFPPPPSDLQPPLPLVKQNVRYCVDRFCLRQQEEQKMESYLKLKSRSSETIVKHVIDKLLEQLTG